MTNRELQDFNDAIHNDLKPKPEGNHIVIEEEQQGSKIKQILLRFKNSQDAMVIQQKPKECLAIKNLFEQEATLKSCDFIVLICKKQKVKIFFCEIKSSLCEDNYEKSLKQIRSSKIFLEYLYKNYKEVFSKEDFKLSLEQAENCLIYPIDNNESMPEKSGTNIPEHFIPKPIEIDKKGICKIENAYDFFRI